MSQQETQQPKDSWKVLVVIVTYNGTHWLSDCLGSLRDSSIPLDVLVVDNLSTDNTAEVIKTDFPEVQLIESEKNLGFGKANNIGLQKALDEGFDYVFMLNQDAWLVEKETIQTLIEAHQLHTDYGIISPMHLNKEKSKLDNKFANYVSQASNLSLMSDLLLKDLSIEKIYEIGFVNAAAWLISRECLEATGGFDPLFFHYGEDEDYIQRVIYHKFKIGFSPLASIVHDREGYVKQSDMRRSLPTQYKDNLIILKNVHRSYNTNLYVALRNEFYYGLVALFTIDITLFSVKVRLISKILAVSSAARKSWRYCRRNKRAYLT